MIVESVMKQPAWFDFLKEINAGAIKPPKSREDQTGIAIIAGLAFFWTILVQLAAYRIIYLYHNRKSLQKGIVYQVFGFILFRRLALFFA